MFFGKLVSVATRVGFGEKPSVRKDLPLWMKRMRVLRPQDLLNLKANSIFLAGRTSLSTAVETWRTDALRELEKLEFDGDVLVPQPYPQDFDWEYRGLQFCSLICFWVPLAPDPLPGFNNVEFGRYVSSGRVLYGRPPNSPETDYLDWLYRRLCDKEPFETLADMLRYAATFDRDAVMNTALKVLDDNHEQTQDSLIGFISKHQRWSVESYWTLDKALYDLVGATLEDNDLYRTAVHHAIFTYSHLLLSFSWHFDPNDDWQYETMDCEEVYKWRERVQLTFEGFLTGVMPSNSAAELQNPLLL